jgi:hypothetical protein
MQAECKAKVNAAERDKNDMVAQATRSFSEKLAAVTNECNSKVSEAEREKDTKIQ